MTNEHYKSTIEYPPFNAVLKRIFDIHCEGKITDEQARRLVDSVHKRMATGEIGQIPSRLIVKKANNPKRIRKWIAESENIRS